MTKIWYDTEFIEDGKTIDLISIGMVRDDGKTYYAVNFDPLVIHRALAHPWLRTHVLPHLPLDITGPDSFRWHRGVIGDTKTVKSTRAIASDVEGFILGQPDPQLRAWYAAYDHVALMQLWGPMISKPEGIPMWTYDLRQEAERLGNPQVPEQAPGEEHNALFDAFHDREIDRFLKRYADSLPLVVHTEPAEGWGTS